MHDAQQLIWVLCDTLRLDRRPLGYASGASRAACRRAEMTKRTDAVLARLLGVVDQKVGLSRTLVILTADHGAADSLTTTRQ